MGKASVSEPAGSVNGSLLLVLCHTLMLELINGRRCPTPPTQGFVLGQYALLWAQQNADKVDRLLVLNTPLAKSSKLRPELAAYKAPLPFMRPGSVSPGVRNPTAARREWGLGMLPPL